MIGKRRVAALLSSQSEGDVLQSLDYGSERQRQWLRSRRQEENNVVFIIPSVTKSRIRH